MHWWKEPECVCCSWSHQLLQEDCRTYSLHFTDLFQSLWGVQSIFGDKGNVSGQLCSLLNASVAVSGVGRAAAIFISAFSAALLTGLLLALTPSPGDLPHFPTLQSKTLPRSTFLLSPPSRAPPATIFLKSAFHPDGLMLAVSHLCQVLSST